MKDQLQEILDSLDEKTPRSRLAPYRKLIIELRRRKYAYREIRRILREKCQVQVSISTLHDFVRAQARKKTQRPISTTAVSERPEPKKADRTPEIVPMPIPLLTLKSSPPVGSPDEIRQRIAALKQRAAQPPEPEAKLFDYDPDQPLHLVPEK